MKNKSANKAPANNVTNVLHDSGEKGSSVVFNSKHHKKPKKIYE